MLLEGTGSWNVRRGSFVFEENKCPVTACQVDDDHYMIREADVVLTKSSSIVTPARPARQVWMLFMLESPTNTGSLSDSNSVFNWTSTFRRDSTLVAPYEKYVPLNDSLLVREPVRNFALGKTKKVAWFVSNCGTVNQRLLYAKELSRHIEVDIYGGCGTLQCPRSDNDACYTKLNKDYKFYLSFENSNCRDYISEKFFITGLKNDVIPVVMGAAPQDYRRAAPPHSFIHVDDFRSPAELAEYLHKLDKDDTLYNQYFAWKGLWTNINTFFWCRLCALAHDIERRGPSWYDKINTWWRGPGVCVGKEGWRNASRVIGHLAVQAN